MTETASTSESSVNFYQTTRRNNPEDIHLQRWDVFSNLSLIHEELNNSSLLKFLFYMFRIRSIGNSFSIHALSSSICVILLVYLSKEKGKKHYNILARYFILNQHNTRQLHKKQYPHLWFHVCTNVIIFGHSFVSDFRYTALHFLLIFAST
jgi:hypothetical protein